MGAFVGEKNLDDIKMHGTTIKIVIYVFVLVVVTTFVQNYVAQNSSQNGVHSQDYHTSYISVS